MITIPFCRAGLDLVVYFFFALSFLVGVHVDERTWKRSSVALTLVSWLGFVSCGIRSGISMTRTHRHGDLRH